VAASVRGLVGPTLRTPGDNLLWVIRKIFDPASSSASPSLSHPPSRMVGAGSFAVVSRHPIDRQIVAQPATGPPEEPR
jgi:hypothetical protein